MYLVQKLVFLALLPFYKEKAEIQGIKLIIRGDTHKQWYHRNLSGFSISIYCLLKDLYYLEKHSKQNSLRAPASSILQSKIDIVIHMIMWKVYT